MPRAARLLLLALFVAACQSEAPEAPVLNPAWAVQPVQTTARFQAVHPVDARVVWASGTEGTFARSLDGGAVWQVGRVPGADSLQFRDLHAVDAETAYLLSAGSGAASRIYKTTDGGASWDLQFTNTVPDGFYSCFAFWDENRGVGFSDAVDGRIAVIRTEDGATWTPVPADNVPPALEGEGGFAASGTCIVTQPGGYAWIGTGASGVMARVLRSTDYGLTWTAAETPIASTNGTSGIFSLAFRDPQHGVALGGDFAGDTRSQNVATTSDGGATWTLVGSTNLIGAVFGGAYVPGASTPLLVAVSPDGSDFSTDEGRTWARIDSVDYWAVAFHSPSAGWAVGPEGRIARIEGLE